MSRLCFVLYFVALSTCATVAFTSCFLDNAAASKSAEFAAYLDAPIPPNVYSGKHALPRTTPPPSLIALAN